jgi:hypothetical protein
MRMGLRRSCTSTSKALMEAGERRPPVWKITSSGVTVTRWSIA